MAPGLHLYAWMALKTLPGFEDTQAMPLRPTRFLSQAQTEASDWSGVNPRPPREDNLRGQRRKAHRDNRQDVL